MSDAPGDLRARILWHWPLWLALGVLWLTRGLLLALDVFPFNSDEAVVALMARHTLAGHPPVFFYGQAYMGSLDAIFSAVVMAVIGQQPLAIRLVQAALYSGTLVLVYLLALRLFGARWAAGAAALLMALPTVLMTLYASVSLGGYGEMLLAGHALLLWTLRLQAQERHPLEWLGWGALAGLAFWAFGFVGVYIAPAGLVLGWPLLQPANWRGERRAFLFGRVLRLVVLGVGFVVGASPWWWATLTGGLATLRELTGEHIGQESPWYVQMGLRLFSLVLFGGTAVSGLRPPWSVELLALPLAPFGLILALGALGYGLWKLRRTDTPAEAKLGLGLVYGVLATNAAGFVLTSFGNDPSGRYFLPMAAAAALLGGGLLNELRQRQAVLANVALGGWLLFHAVGHGQVTADYLWGAGPGFTTQFDAVAQVDRRYDDDLLAFLRAEGELRGYGNYWVTFPLAFLSAEEVQYAARLPYHENFAYTPRDDRYEPYREAVADADRVAYITTHHPALNDYLRAEFARLGVAFAEAEIGDYTVFYDLSRVVRPQEIGLGENFLGFADDD